MIERVDPLGKLHYDKQRDFAEQLREIAEKEMQLICDPGLRAAEPRADGRVHALRSTKPAADGAVRRKGKRPVPLVQRSRRGRQAGQARSTRASADLFVAMLKSSGLLVFGDRMATRTGQNRSKRIIDEACLT
jgi:TetR/AcrR family transcriptional regulator of autoinduction and epiphytic fitness